MPELRKPHDPKRLSVNFQHKKNDSIQVEPVKTQVIIHNKLPVDAVLSEDENTRLEKFIKRIGLEHSYLGKDFFSKKDLLLVEAMVKQKFDK